MSFVKVEQDDTGNSPPNTYVVNRSKRNHDEDDGKLSTTTPAVLTPYEESPGVGVIKADDTTGNNPPNLYAIARLRHR